MQLLQLLNASAFRCGSASVGKLTFSLKIMFEITRNWLSFSNWSMQSGKLTWGLHIALINKCITLIIQWKVSHSRSCCTYARDCQDVRNKHWLSLKIKSVVVEVTWCVPCKWTNHQLALVHANWCELDFSEYVACTYWFSILKMEKIGKNCSKHDWNMTVSKCCTHDPESLSVVQFLRWNPTRTYSNYRSPLHCLIFFGANEEISLQTKKKQPSSGRGPGQKWRRTSGLVTKVHYIFRASTVSETSESQNSCTTRLLVKKRPSSLTYR